MLDILIDGDGQSWPISSPEISRRVRSDLGSIHVRAVGRAVIVSLHPPRVVGPITMTNAFRAIVELKPECTFVYAHTKYPQSMVFTEVDAALDWIKRLVAEGREHLILGNTSGLERL